MDFLSSSSLAILAEVADRDWSNERFLMFLFLREVLATDPFTSFTGPATKSNIMMKEGDSEKMEEDETVEVRRRRKMIQGRSGEGERGHSPSGLQRSSSSSERLLYPCREPPPSIMSEPSSSSRLAYAATIGEH